MICGSQSLAFRENIGNLRDTFFELIVEAKRIISIKLSATALQSPKDKLSPAHLEDMKAIILTQESLRTLLEHILGIYMLYFILEWPKKVSDPIRRQKLYTITFQKIQEIHLKLLETFPAGQKSNTERIVDDFFVLKPDLLKETFTSLNDIGLGDQAKSVIDLLWKFSSPFISDGLRNLFANMLAIIYEGTELPPIKTAKDLEALPIRKHLSNLISTSYNWRRLIEIYDDLERELMEKRRF